MRFSRAWMVLLALLALPGSALAQTIQGRVATSMGEAVAGATVRLLDAGFQPVAEATTNDDGRYRLTPPGDGDYTVVVESEGYANQLSDPIPVIGDATVTFDVEVALQRVGEAGLNPGDNMSDAELLANAIAQQCEGTFVPQLHAILFGSIRDESTEMPLPEGKAVILYADRLTASFGDRRVEQQGDASGAYLICDAPAGSPLRVRGEALGTDGEEANVRLTAGTMRRMDLLVDVSDPATPGDILGEVIDQSSGQRVVGATIRLEGTDHDAITNDRGMFFMSGVPWGTYELFVEHIAYGEQTQEVRVLGGRAHDIEVRVSPRAIEIAPILVRIRPKRWFGDMVGLEERIRRGFGVIKLREQIETEGSVNLAEVLRGIPGVRVRGSGSAMSGSYTIQMRLARDMLGNPCPPTVWVDGVKYGKDPTVYNTLLGIELEAVEAYRGPSETPGEFLDGEASCGVVVVWSRRGTFNIR